MSELTPQQAQILLDKLSNDDAFRAALTANPEAALKAAGLPTTLADCVSTQSELPTKAAAKSALDSLSKQSASLMSQNIHNLK